MEELLLERQLNSKTFDNGDGTREVRIYGTPIHYDKNGILEDIDVNFYLNTTSSPAYYLFNTSGNTFRIGLSEDLSKPKSIKFSFRYDGLGDIYTSLNGIALYDSSLDEFKVFETPKANKGTIEGNIAKYESVYSGIDIELYSLEDQLKEYIYINDTSNIPNPEDFGFNPETTYVVLLNNIETNLLNVEYTNEQLEVYNDGVKKLSSPKEWAKDSSGKDLSIINNFNSTTGEYYYGIPYSEIQSASFPIVIDPTWSTSKLSDTTNNYDTWIKKNSLNGVITYTNNYTSISDFYGVGYNSATDFSWLVSALKFDLSGFTYGATNIASATLNVNDANNMRIKKINSSWNYTDVGQGIFDNVLNGTTIVDSYNYSSSGVTITNTVKEWLTTPSTNYGIGILKSNVDYTVNPTSSNNSFFNSFDYGSSTYRPYISINYYTTVNNFKGISGYDSIKWTWSQVSEASKYIIYDENNVKLFETTSGTTLEWLETNKLPSTPYTRKIKYYAYGGESTTEATFSATTLSEQLVPVSSFTTSNVASNSITWNWVDTNYKNITPAFDGGAWTKSTTTSNYVVFTNSKKLTFNAPTYSTYSATSRISVLPNTTYFVSFIKTGSINLSLLGVQSGVGVNTFYEGTYGNALVYKVENTTNTQIDFTISNNGQIGTSNCENLVITHDGTNLYEILNQYGSVVKTLTPSEYGSWIESGVKYDTEYIRSIRKYRNHEVSTLVEARVTTPQRTEFTGLTKVVYPSQDTYIANDSTSSNFESQTTIPVGVGNSYQTYRSLFKFNKLGIGSIANATFKLNTTTVSNSPVLNLHNITSSWNSTTVNWNTQPAYDSTPISTSQPITSGWNNIDVTNLINGWLNKTANIDNGFLMKTNNESSAIAYSQFHSINSNSGSDYYPQLTLNYSASQPIAPTNLTAKQNSNNKIIWSWDDNDNNLLAEGYRLYNADNDTIVATIINDKTYTETIQPINSSSDFKTYNRYVVAYNSLGESNIVARISYTTMQIASFYTDSTKNTSTSLSWNWEVYANGGHEKVVIYNENNIKLTEVLVGSNTWTETNLTPNTTYKRKFRVVVNGVESTSEQVVYGTTYNTLNAPTSLIGTVNSYKSVTWTWEDNTNGSVQYELLDKFGNIIATTGNKTYTETSLRYNTVYERRIRAKRNTETSNYLSVTTTTPDRPQGAGATVITEDFSDSSLDNALITGDFYTNGTLRSPTNASDASTSACDLVFNTKPNQIQFDWYVDSEKNYDYFSVDLVYFNTPTTRVTISAIHVSGNQTGTFSSQRYEYGIDKLVLQYSKDASASTGGDYGSIDNLVMTFGNPIPPMPITNFIGTQIGLTSVKWTWQKGDSSTVGYRIYNSDNNQLIAEIVGVDNTTYTETNITNNTVNRYVVAYNGAGETSAVNASLNLIQVANLTGTPLTPYSIKWTWESNTVDKVIIYDNSGTKLQEVLGGTKEWIETTNLAPNTSYTRKLKYVKDGVEKTDEISGIGSTYAELFPVSGFTANSVAWNSITWNWVVDTNNKGVTAYEILNQKGVVLKTALPTDTSWTETNLRYDSDYIRKIRVKRNAEYSNEILATVKTSARPTSMPSTNITLYPSADTYVFSGASSSKFYDSTSLFVGNYSGAYRILMKFPFLSTTIPSGCLINNATLRLKQVSYTSSEYFNIYPITTSWNPTLATYANQPSRSNTSISTKTGITTGNNDFILDKSAINTSLDTYGIMIVGNESVQNRAGLLSSETNNDKPQLIIDYSYPLPPLKPTNFTGTTLNSNAIRWSWVAGDNLATEYRIYNAENDQLIGTTTSTTYDETNITLGNTLNRYVVAYNGGGESPSSSTTLETTALTSFVGIPTSPTSIKWDWTTISTVDKFVIYDSYNAKVKETTDGTTLTWTETNLSPYTDYTRKIKYVIGGVEKTGYLTTIAKTYALLVEPQNIVVTPINSNTITWSWDDVVNTNYTGFEVLDKYNNILYTCSNSVKSWTESKLRYNTNYDRYIRTVRNAEKGTSIKITGKTQDRPTVVDELVTTETINANFDTYVYSANPTSNYGTNSVLSVGKSGTNIWRSLLGFDLSNISSGKVLKSAKLRMYQSGVSGTPPIIDVFKNTQTWNETIVTWNTVPTKETTKIVSIDNLTSQTGIYYEKLIPADTLNSWVGSNTNNFGLTLFADTASGYSSFNSKEGTYKPELVISHEMPISPKAPTNFRGSIKSDNKILWKWDETTSVNAQGYRIYNAENDQVIADIPIGVSTYEETASLGQTYNRYIVAYNTYGETSIVSTTMKFEIAPPTNIVGKGLTSTKVVWTFDDNGCSEYKIYSFNGTTNTLEARIKFENSSFNTYLESNPSVVAYTSNKLEYIKNNLQPNTTLNIKVSSVYETNESSLSESISATSYDILANTQTFIGTTINHNTITWSWDDTINQGITGFEVLDANLNVIYTCNNTIKTWSETNLRYSTIYKRYVRTIRLDEKSGRTQAETTTQARPTSTTITLNPTEDTLVSLGSVAENFGYDTHIYVGKPVSSSAFESYLKFNTSSIPSDKQITNAKLRLYADSYSDIIPTINVRKITSNWNEMTVNWNTKPTYNLTNLAQMTISSSNLNRYYEVDLLATQLQSWITNLDNFGLAIIPQETTVGYVQLHSRENTFKPELTLTYEGVVAPLPTGTMYGTVASGTSITWAWDASASPDVTGYKIYDSETDRLIADVLKPNTTYTEQNLALGHTYNRYVVAYNQYGESSANSITLKLDIVYPTNIMGTPQSSSRILWGFDNVGYNEYRIYEFSTTTYQSTLIGKIVLDNGEYKAYKINDLSTPIGTYTTPKYLQSGLKPNTTYYIKVSSVGSFEGETSNSVNSVTNRLPQKTVLNGSKNGLNNLKWIIS